MRKLLPAVRRISFLLLLAACGSRTGLFVDDDGFTEVEGPEGPDSGPSTRRDAGRLDAAVDATPPPIDARPPTDAPDRSDCPDAEATLIYTITSTYELQSFNPNTGSFKLIGRISCPTSGTQTPFSMAVDRRGIAYVLFTDNKLYRVSTANAACTSTPYVAGQSNFRRFGMGFATNSIGPTETLYVAGSDQGDNAARGLAEISTTTWKLAPVGEFNPFIEQAELTGTGDGRLFAFYRKNGDSPPTFIGQIDPNTADVVGERRFDNVDLGDGWAFAYWGGDFYMFHAPGGSTRVTRWRPDDDSVAQVATTNLRIVGAGVSTCAPSQ